MYGTGTPRQPSPRVQEAQKLDAVEFIQKAFQDQWRSKNAAETKNAADQEAAETNARLVQSRMQDLIIMREAKKFLRKDRPNRRKKTWAGLGPRRGLP